MLQPAQRDKLLASFTRSPLPLYLKLAFEEVRRWRSFDPLGHLSGRRTFRIIDQLFSRLAEDANHGPVLVNKTLRYLTAARYGLTEVRSNSAVEQMTRCGATSAAVPSLNRQSIDSHLLLVAIAPGPCALSYGARR